MFYLTHCADWLGRFILPRSFIFFRMDILLLNVKVQLFNVHSSISLTGSSLPPSSLFFFCVLPPTPGSTASAARCLCTASSHLALVMEVLLLQDTHGLLDYDFLSSSILAVGVSLLFCSFSQLAASDLWTASSPPTLDSNAANMFMDCFFSSNC